MTGRRPGKRSGRRSHRERGVADPRPSAAGMAGGLYRPLTPRAMERIHEAALDVLERVGLAQPTPTVQDLALAKGCTRDDAGRLRFPRALVEDTVAGACRDFVLCGQRPEYDMQARPGWLHFATGGAAVKMLDIETGSLRLATSRAGRHECCEVGGDVSATSPHGPSVLAFPLAPPARYSRPPCSSFPRRS